MSFSENFATGFRPSEMRIRWNALINESFSRVTQESAAHMLSSMYDRIECSLQPYNERNAVIWKWKKKKKQYSSVQLGPELHNEIAIVFRSSSEVFLTCEKCSYTNSYVSGDLLVICLRCADLIVSWRIFRKFFQKTKRSPQKVIDSIHFVRCTW